jgi:hypothetical protein
MHGFPAFVLHHAENFISNGHIGSRGNEKILGEEPKVEQTQLSLDNIHASSPDDDITYSPYHWHRHGHHAIFDIDGIADRAG